MEAQPQPWHMWVALGNLEGESASEDEVSEVSLDRGDMDNPFDSGDDY